MSGSIERVAQDELFIACTRFRSLIAPFWNSETVSPFYTPPNAHEPDTPARGQCAPSSILLSRYLRANNYGNYLPHCFTVRKREADIGRTVIGFHVSLVEPRAEDPLILDITADQGFGTDYPVIVGRQNELRTTYGQDYELLGAPLRIDMLKRARLLCEAATAQSSVVEVLAS